MKHHKTIHAQVAEETVLDFISCDFCGEETNSAGKWDLGQTMTAQAREESHALIVTETIKELSLNSHVCYSGEAWSAREWNLDICPACFETKVVPLALPERRSPRDSC